MIPTTKANGKILMMRDVSDFRQRTTTSLAACSTPSGIQASRSHVQGSTRSHADVPLRRLSVGGGSRSMSAIG